MPRAGPRKIYRYSDEFKLAAVRLSQQPGMQVQTVAAALEIHPFMLSKWRRETREGTLRGRARPAPRSGPARKDSGVCQPGTQSPIHAAFVQTTGLDKAGFVADSQCPGTQAHAGRANPLLLIGRLDSLRTIVREWPCGSLTVS
jgi:hypothetical protein